MVTHSMTPAPGMGVPMALRYALLPVHGPGIVAMTVARMLDDGADGARARILAPGEAIPYGAAPVLISDTTVYGALRVEETVQRWGPLPKPWLVWVADAPARPVQDARYLVRALEGRLAGVVRVPYLPVLRAVKGPEEALEHKEVRSAAERLRRTMGGN
ncbi:hypothetical protein AB0B21_33075 [Streptomyces rimosus]|uniref:hypothetical protein n=1 Tax=Streptomyces rimosus TaxID=1927 RepID=UPI000B2880DA|nr:hypothetical protein [Streptomyces rimosus]